MDFVNLSIDPEFDRDSTRILVVWLANDAAPTVVGCRGSARFDDPHFVTDAETFNVLWCRVFHGAYPNMIQA